MEPIEILGLCILLFVILLLVAYIVILKLQINKFTKKVDELLDQEYNELIKIDTFDKSIVDLAKSMNKHVFLQRKLASDYIEERKKLNNLVSGISHDFRTPLTASIGYLQMIQKSGVITDTKNQEYLRIAIDKNMYLKQLSDDFFDVSKMSVKASREVNVEKVLLSSILEERLLEQFDWINDRGIVPEINIDSDVYIDIDKHDIDRVIYNIFSNCQKYAVSTLKVLLTKEKLVISNGVMDSNEIDADKVFEPFYRGVSRNKEGSGLGLYVVSCIANEYGFGIEASLVKNEFAISIVFDKKESQV